MRMFMACGKHVRRNAPSVVGLGYLVYAAEVSSFNAYAIYVCWTFESLIITNRMCFTLGSGDDAMNSRKVSCDSLLSSQKRQQTVNCGICIENRVSSPHTHCS